MILDSKERKKLAQIGNEIYNSLYCSEGGDGLPCRTDRLSAVDGMKKYLEIHDYKITKKESEEK